MTDGDSMKTPVRILLAAAALALALGWVGLRRGNAALETRLTAADPLALPSASGERGKERAP
jgi:hypothetical protein